MFFVKNIQNDKGVLILIWLTCEDAPPLFSDKFVCVAANRGQEGHAFLIGHI